LCRYAVKDKFPRGVRLVPKDDNFWRLLYRPLDRDIPTPQVFSQIEPLWGETAELMAKLVEVTTALQESQTKLVEVTGALQESQAEVVRLTAALQEQQVKLTLSLRCDFPQRASTTTDRGD
jgi:hypothetical protein